MKIEKVLVLNFERLGKFEDLDRNRFLDILGLLRKFGISETVRSVPNAEPEMVHQL